MMMLSRTTMTNRMIQIRPLNRLGSFSRGCEWSLSRHGCANRAAKSLGTNRRPERFETNARDARHQACGLGSNGIELSICWSLRRKQPWMLRFERWMRNNAFVVVAVWRVVGFVSVIQQQPFLLWCHWNCCCCCSFVQPEYLEYHCETIDRAKLFFFFFSR